MVLSCFYRENVYVIQTGDLTSYQLILQIIFYKRDFYSQWGLPFITHGSIRRMLALHVQLLQTAIFIKSNM